MKMRATLALIVAAFTMSAASIANASDKPQGVADKDWIAISEKFGFVIDEKNASTPHSYPPPSGSRQVLIAPPDAVSAELMPPAKGYFVVKTQQGWRRIAMAE